MDKDDCKKADAPLIVLMNEKTEHIPWDIEALSAALEGATSELALNRVDQERIREFDRLSKQLAKLNSEIESNESIFSEQEIELVCDVTHCIWCHLDCL